MGKGHRQRDIQNRDRWDSEYDRIYPPKPKGEQSEQVHREGDGEEAAQAEGHVVRDGSDATSEGPQGRESR